MDTPAETPVADTDGLALVQALRAERDALTELAEERLRGQHGLSNQLNDTARELNGRLAAAEAQVGALREAAANLMRVFPDPCRHDHHGYCQEHFIEAECSVFALKSALAALAAAQGGNCEPEAIRPIWHVALRAGGTEGFITDSAQDADWTATGLPDLALRPSIGDDMREFLDEEDEILPRKYALLFDSEEEAEAAAAKLATS